VERNGDFWVENMPLSNGTNHLTLTVTDAAGNVITTNITVFSGAVTLTINPPSPDSLWAQGINVTGTISDSADSAVWVNGTKATLNGDGTWTATNVYLPTGGTAVLQARAIPNTNNGGNGTGGSGGGPVTYDNLGNPDPAPDIDAEIQVEKPTRLYVASYTEKESGFQDLSDYYMDEAGNPVTPEGLYSTWYREVRTGNIVGSWQDGAGGSSSWTQQEIDTSSADPLTNNSWVKLSYKPTLYPDMEVATRDASDEDISSPFVINWESCNVAKPLINHTGSCLITPEYTYDFYYDLQTWNEPETRQAQATIMLFTGGKGVPGHESLFQLTGSAASAIFAKDPPPTQINLSYEPQQPIPVTSIKMGGLGYLGSDGNLFVALLDGVTETVTPTVQGNQDYIFNATATKHLLVLTANSIDLSTTTPEFCVGQQVQMAATWVPPLPDGTQSTYEWVATLDYIDRIVPGSGDASPLYEMDASLETNNTWNLWWYSGGVSDVFCSTRNYFSNGQIVPLSDDGYVSIYRPTVIFDDRPPSYATNCMFKGSMYLQLGDGNGDGDMDYNAYVRSAYSGKSDIRQLINRYASHGIWAIDTTHDQYYLDTTLFYIKESNDPNAPLPVRANDWLNSVLPFSDNPGYALGGTSTSVSDKFEDYVMFRPNLGNPNNNIYVSLGMAKWAWSATTDYDQNTFQWLNPVGPPVTRPTGFDGSIDFPSYPHIYIAN
jgi:hypothetical protein